MIRLSIAFVSASTFAFGHLCAEQGMLSVHIANPQGRPISGVVLGTLGEGSTSSPTDRSGKTRLRLAPGIQPGAWVALQVAAQRDLVFVSPWNARARVPPFENPSENFVQVVLAPRGDRSLLESRKGVAALAGRVNAASAPAASEQGSVEERRAVALGETARLFGIERSEVDRAIRALAANGEDPYEKGMSALYARDYANAAPQLSEALLTRGKSLRRVPAEVANAAMFLGQALFESGKFDKAVEAYRKALRERPDDAIILNGLGAALLKDGKPELAEPFVRRAAELQSETK
ncbi:MAG: tetratricopeptide repeat protein [Acidobacteriota bacterium]|nr:tetratricopeptide repeat protein [Acidobacteriota bacterium]